GEGAAKIRARIASRSKALAKWVEDDLSARGFARSGLTRLQRALVALGATFPLDAPDATADWVHAVRALGASDESLRFVSDTLARLFREAPEIRNALAGFDAVLGRRVRPLED